MADEVYTFGEVPARRLHRFARKLGSPTRPPREDHNDYNHSRLFKAPTGGIPARSGSTAGSAICKVCYIDPETGNIVETDKEFTVWNFTKSVVVDKGDRYGVAAQDGYGRWIAVAADCSEQ